MYAQDSVLKRALAKLCIQNVYGYCSHQYHLLNSVLFTLQLVPLCSA